MLTDPYAKCRTCPGAGVYCDRCSLRAYLVAEGYKPPVAHQDDNLAPNHSGIPVRQDRGIGQAVR